MSEVLFFQWLEFLHLPLKENQDMAEDEGKEKERLTADPIFFFQEEDQLMVNLMKGSDSTSGSAPHHLFLDHDS